MWILLYTWARIGRQRIPYPELPYLTCNQENRKGVWKPGPNGPFFRTSFRCYNLDLDKLIFVFFTVNV